MVDWLIKLLELYGYIGIFILMAFENIFPPIPSEVILLFSGFMTTYTSLTILGVLITASTGSILGAIVLYGIGYVVHMERLEIVIVKWGNILRLSKKDLYRVNEWFNRFGYLAVFICRMIPLLRSLISIPAGMTKMNFPIFLLFTMLGTMIWNTLLVMLGVVLGVSWRDILRALEIYSTSVYILIGISLIAFIIFYIKKRRKDI